MKYKFKYLAVSLGMALTSIAYAAKPTKTPLEVVINIVDTNGTVASAGVVKYEDTKFGLLMIPNLNKLPKGVHGFHIHENPSCDSSVVKDKIIPAGGAGSHYDPEKTGKHGSPYSELGHKGDLPFLYVADDGSATHAILAPRLKVKELQGRSIMIHAGGDNHTDMPAFGGGGSRIACGVF